MDIWVVDSIFDPDSNKRELSEATIEDKKWYRVWVYLGGSDVPLIKSVTYETHPDLPTPSGTVIRNPQNPNCVFSFWTWGVFPISVYIKDIYDRIQLVKHDLQFSDELRSYRLEQFPKTSEQSLSDKEKVIH